MGKYISCGKFNKNFKYIIFGCFFNILVDFISGFDLNDGSNELLLFPSEKQKILYKHSTVHEIFQYIGVFIFSCVFYKIERILNKKEITSFSSKKSNSQKILIFNDSENKMGRISNLSFILIITIYVCINYLAEIFYQLDLKIFDYWMFELLIISYINAKMFKLKIYRHQMFAIIFNSFICLFFRLPIFILSFSFKDRENNNKLEDGKSLFEISNWYIVLGLIIYVIIITIRAYLYTKIKWYMDLKYISSTNILIYIGFIGIFVFSISCIIETNIKCSERINFCKVKDKANNTYIDNFNIYYKNLSEIEDSAELIYEACIILFGMICEFFSLYYDMLIIKFLTPVHAIFYSSIYYFLIKLIAIFYNRIKFNQFFNGSGEDDKKIIFQSFLDISGNFIAIFGFLIYLEIIELGFCKLNYNLRKYIEKRSLDDITQSNEYAGFNEEDEQSEGDSKDSIASELKSNSL